MIECFFADSLVSGVLRSSLIGQGIVAVQLLASLYMVAIVIGKHRSLSRIWTHCKRTGRNIMEGRDVLEYYLERHPDGHSPVERIYRASCERLVRLVRQEDRAALVTRGDAGISALSAHEISLVRAICDHVLDEEEIALDKGMVELSTGVALAPMLGLLGTVWGVLDAFDAIGAAASASIATMAPAISSALVTTVVGLLIAIPGVLAHNRLAARIRSITSNLEGFADDLVGRIALEFQGRSQA